MYKVTMGSQGFDKTKAIWLVKVTSCDSPSIELATNTADDVQVSKTRAEKQFWPADGFSFVKNPISSCDFIQTVHHVVLLVFMFLVFGRWSDCTVLLQYEVMSASSDWLAYTCMFWSILAIYCTVGNFREGLIFTFFASQEPFAKIKTTKILLSMCKVNKLPFNTQPTWNYLYSRQQKGVSKCAFDGYRWSYPGNWNAT